MTLDEAIRHAEEVAEQNEWFDKNDLESMQCRECAKEHRQLAEWLKELKQLKEQEPKTGHWIERAQYSDGKHKIECSECGNHIFDRGHANSFSVKNKYKYCLNCGTKMEVSE